MSYKTALVLFFLFFTCLSFPQSTTYFVKYKNGVPNSFVDEKIKAQNLLNKVYKPGIPKQYTIDNFAKNLGKEDEILSRIIKITFEDNTEADNYIQQLRSDNDNLIEYIQPSVIYKTHLIPNDSLVSQQWALEKIGAYEAWDITEGEDSVIVGVIDTGIDYLHPDIKNKIYFNQGEHGLDLFGNDKRYNGIDDDGNGFIDDFMGWDFTDRVGFPDDTTADYLDWDNDPMDEHSHGTFVAGILGAETNNRIGIAGAAPNVKILNLRAFDKNGNGEEDDVAAAVLYAVQAGAKVINMSFGDVSFSYVLRDVIRYAHKRNVVLVASSGNKGLPEPHYPSGYSEVISVGNSDVEDRLVSSNYGSTLDLVAPGTGILSLHFDDAIEYEYGSGTSASAPFVSAAAALILSLQNFTNEEVKQIIKSSCDDIGQTGWDIRTGAGRLNMYKALRILSPAKVTFNYPSQDFATFEDTVNINITIMSPYFVKFDLLYGKGLNPDNWVSLISDVRYQTLNEQIFSFQISSLNEGEYTLRLIVSLNNGSTTEERVNFHIQRTPPEIELAGAGPIYYGNRSTVMGEVYTGSLAITRMYYRLKGSGEFKFITLDGFATNNQFVKQFHYGFIPKQLVQPNTFYEIYFEAENLVGLKSVLMDDDGSYFVFRTDPLNEQTFVTELPFNLPRGTLFENPVNFLSNNFDEILFNDLNQIPDTVKAFYSLYYYSDNIFFKEGTIIDQNPIAVGDFNHNGKSDLLSRFITQNNIPAIYINEQTEPATFNLTNKLKSLYSKDTSFYPISVLDLGSDIGTLVFSAYYDSIITVWEINENLKIKPIDTLNNYTSIDRHDSTIELFNRTNRNAVIADLNGDGIKEVWFADFDGDLFSYNISGTKHFTKGNNLVEKIFLIRNTEIIRSGDFDGDGVDEIAVLYNSNSIASYYLLRIFNFKNNQQNILYEKLFLDQSAEYKGNSFTNIHQSLKLVDIDNDSKDELILNIYPYVYIIKHSDEGSKIIYYDEEINTEAIFAGDLNQNGATEIALQTADGYKFYEFTPSLKPNIPTHLSGFSIDSTTVKLQWHGSAQKYLIFKGIDKNSLSLYDSTTALNFEDNDVSINKNYYYSIKAVDLSKQISFSEFGNIIEVYSHKPAYAIRAESSNRQNVLISFSERINNTIESLQAFELIGTGIPNSVTASSQFSYLLSFNDLFPVGENRIIINGLHDYYGSSIKPDTLTFIVNQTDFEQEFFISSHEILNPFRIKINFNFEVNETSAAQISNYIFDPANNVESVLVDPADKKIIYLNLTKEKPVGSIGREYRLKIENLLSSDGIKINSGAGSYIVLTSFAPNLSDVYVYPSPVKFINGNEKITFANLPQRAQIKIFTLDGKQLATLEEKDGNGGIDFNLRKDSGELFNSGIYIFRVIRFDSQDNEVEEKLGKFVIIR